MDTFDDKQWASRYLLDPLTAPEPSQETGPGTHHTTNPISSGSTRPTSKVSTIGDRRSSPAKSRPVSGSSRNSYPSPPASTLPSPRRDKSAARREGFAGSDTASTAQRASSEIPTSTVGGYRNSLLSSRFDGDRSHRPLDIIKRDVLLANRAPHLRKKHHVGADSIDNLDTVGGAYHHEGPFDATLLAKNLSYKSSPVEAVRRTNLEALKATPREMVRDSVERHRPLDGVARVAPGMADENGRVYRYQEGADLMIEDGGNYKRWPGVDYLPEDLKGKGEPSYSIERALKEHKQTRRRTTISDGNSGIEMTACRPTLRPASSGTGATSNNPPVQGQRYADWEEGLRNGSLGPSGPSGSSGAGGGALRKRFGSVRRR